MVAHDAGCHHHRASSRASTAAVGREPEANCLFRRDPRCADLHYMNLSESPRTAARFAAVVLTVGGMAGLLADHLMLHQGGANDVLSVIYSAVGIVVWYLPWQRWSPRTTVILAFGGLAMIATSRAMGTEPSASFVASFAMVFLWVGMSQPPGTSFLLAPPALAAYVTAILVSPRVDTTELGSIAIVLPMLLVAGEVPARMVAELRAARAIEHDQARRFAEQAETDSLTGLGNRRFGEAVLETLVAGDAVLLLDVDHFKAVNDRFGHAGGDRLLRDLAEHLRGSSRAGDSVARFGGEEFLLVVRQGATRGGDSAMEVAERIVQGWRERQPQATVSVGVAIHDGSRSPTATCSQADTALYRAKRSGRDRARLFGSEPAPSASTQEAVIEVC
jgi:diguanylate cyclase (GGDEF)-like protein